MIPKIIHYCQFGGKPLNRLSRKCLASWRKFLPDYEIKEWNESNFDVNICAFTKEAYKAKNYAFVSDYARLWILYHYGGIYFDTDVEILKPMDAILRNGPYMGCEEEAKDCQQPLDLHINPGLGIAAEPHMPFIKELLDHYTNEHYADVQGNRIAQTIVIQTSQLLVPHGLQLTSEPQTCAGFTIYPKEYFCPKHYNTNRVHVTPRTITFHHYGSSWYTPYQSWHHWMEIHMPRSLELIKRTYRIIKYFSNFI